MNFLFFAVFPRKKLTKYSQNPSLVNQFSATPRGQLNWTGPIANGSDSSVSCPSVFCCHSARRRVSRDMPNFLAPTPSRGRPRPHPKVSGPKSLCLGLEAQKRYFSYRAILVAIVSQNYFVFVFMGYRTVISRNTLRNGVSHTCACVKRTTKGGYRTNFGECQPPFKSIAQYVGHPQTRHETPTRHETTYFAQSTPWLRPQRNLWCFAVFKAMNFDAPSIPDINPTRNNMKKHHKIRSKPNMNETTNPT